MQIADEDVPNQSYNENWPRVPVTCADSKCHANFSSDGHLYCIRHAVCTGTFIFKPNSCCVCRPAWEFLKKMKVEPDKKAYEFVLLRDRWLALIKLASKYKVNPRWEEEAVAFRLGLTEVPPPSLSSSAASEDLGLHLQKARLYFVQK